MKASNVQITLVIVSVIVLGVLVLVALQGVGDVPPQQTPTRVPIVIDPPSGEGGGGAESTPGAPGVQEEEAGGTTSPEVVVQTPEVDGQTPDIVGKPGTSRSDCEQSGGVWYDASEVCEINAFTEVECVDAGGEYNACASACRHDPRAEMCTMQCVLTCTFRS